MSRNTSKINVSVTDEHINNILQKSLPPAMHEEKAVCHYNQNEDQFLKLSSSVLIDSLPVHHHMDDPVPPKGYMQMLETLCSFLIQEIPDLIANTKWIFNPLAIHRPLFYRIETIEDTSYLYLLMIDVTARPLEHEILIQGTNDKTHSYRTNRLYFECDYFPLASVTPDITIFQTIPVTWKGESGEGYMIHGIWMDADINKFFSKLILPAGKRSHPYYPITCKQHCVSMNAYGQKNALLLHSIRTEIEGFLSRILVDLQSSSFSEIMPLFVELKKNIPKSLGARWKDLRIDVQLNQNEQKEYTVEF